MCIHIYVYVYARYVKNHKTIKSTQKL
jgi:hypothetical protein